MNRVRVMARRAFISAATLGLLTTPLASLAQQAGTLQRAWASWVTWKVGASRSGPDGRRGRKYERLPGLAAELVRLRTDVIVTAAVPAIRAAKRATRTIPIVTAVVVDPVATGLVASLARPGGNITGLRP